MTLLARVIQSVCGSRMQGKKTQTQMYLSRHLSAAARLYSLCPVLTCRRPNTENSSLSKDRKDPYWKILM